MIQTLRLKNFRRYVDATLRFAPGVNFIEGANSVGKTTVLYAIEYALFGRIDGFKSATALAHPGARGVGVELVFTGRDGRTWRLQRVHATPKGKRTMAPGFTLKVTEPLPADAAPDAAPTEKYVLSSDFADTEDALQLVIQEQTGITRRLFQLAVHMRQGDIARILEGEPKLDIVLGVTAAVIAEEELRTLALEDEKLSAELPILESTLQRASVERATLAERIGAAEAEQAGLAAQIAGLAGRLDALAAREHEIAPAKDAAAALERAVEAANDASRRAAEADEALAEALAAGGPRADADARLTRLAAQEATRAAEKDALSERIAASEAERRELDGRAGDLKGRAERRAKLLAGGAATCESCGAPIDADHAHAEITAWNAELSEVDAGRAACSEALAGARAARSALDNADKEDLLAAAALKAHLAALDKLEAAVGRTTDASSSARDAASAAVVAARALVHLPDGEPAAVRDALREALAARLDDLRAQKIHIDADRRSLDDLQRRVEEGARELTGRLREVEREITGSQAKIRQLRVFAQRAQRARAMSAGFKELQTLLRSEAATALAADLHAIHQALSDRPDEFASLAIDPARYALEVEPRHIKERVSAAVYEGGGHKLLLGLAYRLAIVRRLGQVPLVLLDEPTYGLDTAHRAALLSRLDGLGLIGQILLITHEAMGGAAGRHVRVARAGDASVVLPEQEPS